jgi:hypothetical protein
MKNKIIPILIIILLTSACNLPRQETTPLPAESIQQTAATLPIQPIQQTASALPTFPPSATATWTETPTPTPTALPADLPFSIDCSALPASRQADCDAFIKTTQDQVYPILRQVTGVSLSKCYSGMHYILLPTDPAPGAGGESGGDTISLNEKYSIDLIHPYDVHELLHSISSCARALDTHVFHGMILNYTYDRLGVHDAGFFTDRSAQDLTIILDHQLNQVKTASGQDWKNLCIGILMRKTTVAYFDLGGQVIQTLYRSTLYPPKTSAAPNPKLVSVWAEQAGQVQALLESLQQNYQYQLDVPECGY